MGFLHRPCPSFSVPDIDGRLIRPEDFHGGYLWLLFHRHLA